MHHLWQLFLDFFPSQILGQSFYSTYRNENQCPGVSTTFFLIKRNICANILLVCTLLTIVISCWGYPTEEGKNGYCDIINWYYTWVVTPKGFQRPQISLCCDLFIYFKNKTLYLSLTETLGYHSQKCYQPNHSFNTKSKHSLSDSILFYCFFWLFRPQWTSFCQVCISLNVDKPLS